MLCREFSRICSFSAIAVLALFGCGRTSNQIGSSKSPSSGSSDSEANPPEIVTYGNNCKSGNVATTMLGFDARIALEIRNASPQTHSLGFDGNPDGFTINFSEVVFRGKQQGTFTLKLVLRDRAACLATDINDQECQIDGRVVDHQLSFDTTKDVKFIVSQNMETYLQTGTLGQGQEGLVSNAVNNQGLIGLLAGMGFLKNMGTLGNVVGSAGTANAQLEQLKANPQAKGGCTGQSNTNNLASNSSSK